MANFGVSMPTDGKSEYNRGDRILKTNAGLIKRPSWTKSDPTVIRIFPCSQGNQPQPTRYSDTEFSPWFYACTMVSSFGNPPSTWIANDPEDRSYDTRTNPAVMVYELANAVAKGPPSGIRGPQEWALTLRGGAGKSALVSKPDTALLVRCAIYESKGTPNSVPDGLAPNHQPVFMMLKKSAWQSMNRELSILKESGTQGLSNPNDKYVSGDIVSLNNGSYVLFFEVGMPPRGYASSTPAAGGFPAGKNKPIGYDCIISPTYRGAPASFTDAEAGVVMRKIESPIRDCLNFPSDEEQVRYVVDSLKGSHATAGLVVHALRDRYERFIPVEVMNYGNEYLRNNGLMATAVSNPGFVSAPPPMPTWNNGPPQVSDSAAWNANPIPQYAYPSQPPRPVPVAPYPVSNVNVSPANLPDPRELVEGAKNTADTGIDSSDFMSKLAELRAKSTPTK